MSDEVTSPAALGTNRSPRVVIVGGGLAGLAAAVATIEAGCRVTLYEARRQLGGRAASFREPYSGELVDYCQHVGMGACTNFVDFCGRTGILPHFRRDRTLHFFTADGRQYNFQADRGWPAPLHLARGLLHLGYLSWAERLHIGTTMLRLARLKRPPEITVAEWLREQKVTPHACEQFWSVVLVSALGDAIDRTSLAAARKVFVDGFMSTSSAYEVLVPTKTLTELFDGHVARWLTERGGQVLLGAEVVDVPMTGDRAAGVRRADQATGKAVEEIDEADAVIVALPWRRVASVFTPELLAGPLANLARVSEFPTAPITGVHLWFDRPITTLPHAVLVGLQSQWLFRSPLEANTSSAPNEHYYQVVISGSRDLAGREREEIVRAIVAEVAQVWPTVGQARLLRWRVVTDPHSVFVAAPGLSARRPEQATAIANLALAGDWTATGWPATLESAVRSGYRAAEVVLAELRRPASIVQPGLRRSWLARLLVS